MATPMAPTARTTTEHDAGRLAQYLAAMAPRLCQLFALLHLADEVNGAVDAALAPYKLTRPAYHALYNLSEHGCQTQKELACKAGCAPSNITRLIDRLERQGLVVRTPSESDRRQIRATLTEQGRRTFAEASQALEQVQQRFASRVGTPLAPEAG